jgi:thiol-disulfide isomerase/thioredoxin
MLSWCLAAQDGAPPDVAGPFLHPATAAEVLASAARQQPVTPPPAPAPVAPRLPAKGEVFPPVPLPVAAGSVEALRGTPVVVTLWASWCQPCRKELPELAASMQRLRGEGHAVEWLALSVDEHEAAYRRAAQRLPLDGAQVGRRPELLADLAVGEVPTTWVVGPDGRVRLVRSGYSEQLCTQVEQAVEGER